MNKNDLIEQENIEQNRWPCPFCGEYLYNSEDYIECEKHWKIKENK